MSSYAREPLPAMSWRRRSRPTRRARSPPTSTREASGSSTSYPERPPASCRGSASGRTPTLARHGGHGPEAGHSSARVACSGCPGFIVVGASSADQVCAGPPQASGDRLVVAVRGGSTARPDGEVAAGDALELAEAITQLRPGFEALETELRTRWPISWSASRRSRTQPQQPVAGPVPSWCWRYAGTFAAESLWQEPGDWVGWIRNRPPRQAHPRMLGRSPRDSGGTHRFGSPVRRRTSSATHP